MQALAECLEVNRHLSLLTGSHQTGNGSDDDRGEFATVSPVYPSYPPSPTSPAGLLCKGYRYICTCYCLLLLHYQAASIRHTCPLHHYSRFWL